VAYYYFGRAEPWPHGNSAGVLVQASGYSGAQAAMAGVPYVFDGYAPNSLDPVDHATEAEAAAGRLPDGLTVQQAVDQGLLVRINA
jgi:hypothetical protein